MRASRQLDYWPWLCWRRWRAVVIGLGLLATAPIPWGFDGADADERDAFAAQGVVRFEQAPVAPDFTLPDLEGTPHRLHDLKGQAVLLVFWTTW